MFYPFMMMNLQLPTINEKPPTLYAILNSIANFGKEDKTKIVDLAKATHETIFNFDYPLSSNIDREEFECMILNKFIMRRIGFDTVTSFQIQLNVKLNEIMPLYNKLFDSIESWNLFNDGENTTRSVTDTRTINGSNTLTNSTADSNISDRRFSNVPQNEISDIQNGTYMTDYNYDVSNGTVNSNSNGTNTSTDNGSLTETISRSPADKINIYKNFIEAKNNIYTMIFKDLDSLFYQLF